jgi:hypothetical protein
MAKDDFDYHPALFTLYGRFVERMPTTLSKDLLPFVLDAAQAGLRGKAMAVMFSVPDK